MKISLDNNPENLNRINGYRDGTIIINATEYRHSLIITPENPVIHWPPETFKDIAVQHLEIVLETKPELLILGTGKTLMFPSPELTENVFLANIGLEVMDTRSACRCFNLLSSEGRKVVAALIIDQET